MKNITFYIGCIKIWSKIKHIKAMKERVPDIQIRRESLVGEKR